MSKNWHIRQRRHGGAWGLARVEGADRLVHATEGGSGIVVMPVALAASKEGAQRASRIGRVRRKGPKGGIVFPIEDLSLRHERLTLPAMKPAMLANAIRQHCTAGQARGSGLEISYTADRPHEDPSDLLVVSVDREVSETTVNNLLADGYRVQRLVSSAAALVGLLRAVGKNAEMEGATVLLHLGQEIGSVAFLSGGVFGLGREFRIPDRSSEEGASEDEPGDAPGHDGEFYDQILEEIDRSLLLFNHKFRGELVGRILLSSDRDRIEPLRRLCSDRFGVQTGLLIDEVALDTSAFGSGDLARRRAALWILPIAAAVLGLREDPDVNLLPSIYIARRSRRRALALAMGIVLATALGMAAYHGSQVATALSHFHDLRVYADLNDKMDQEVRQLASLRRERTDAIHHLEFMAEKRAPLTVLRGVLGLLANSAADSLFIERVDLGIAAGDNSHLVLRLQGKVIAETSAAVQDQFIAFYEALKANHLFEQATVRPLEIEGIAEGRSLLKFDVVAPITKEEGCGDWRS